MTPALALLSIIALVVLAGVAAFVFQRRGAKVREVATTEHVDPEDFGVSQLGKLGTVVQFSTEYCSRCPGVRRQLENLVSARSGIDLIHVDVTADAALATKYQLLQTPTVLLIAKDGRPTTRLSGAITTHDLSSALERLS